MSIIDGKETNTNASPSAYGWVFQVGAGITLFLDNIKDVTAMKMEGKYDDIELFLDAGKIYAQAKSVTQIGNQQSASSNLKDALKLLESDSKNGDAIKLIYITNIVNPLSSDTRSAYQYGNVYDYSILPEQDRVKIQSKLSSGFPLEKLQIYIINFFGEGDNKFSNVKMKIEEFLRTAINDPSYSKRLLDSWFETFMVNCADKPTPEKPLYLNKKDIIMPLIILVVDPPLDESELNRVCEYDDYEELIREYRIVINTRAYDYSFSSGVVGDFLMKRKNAQDKNNYKYEYVKNEWKQYERSFATVEDCDKREALIKLILLTIIKRRDKFRQIKEAANL